MNPKLKACGVTSLPVVMLITLAGCGSSGTNTPARDLALSDFSAAPGALRAPEQAPITPEPVPLRSATQEDDSDVRVVIVGDDPAAAPWASPLATANPLGAGSVDTDTAPMPAQAGGNPSGLVVDQMVGEVNGKPIYASDFLAPFDAQLRAEAARLAPNEWISSTARLVHEALVDRVRDELLLAEFYAALEPEQRAGVLAYVQRMRSNIVSQNLGAEALTEARLLEAEGLTLDEKVKQESERQFILDQLRRGLASKVAIPFRDIERYYDAHPELFESVALRQYQVIRVAPERRDEVTGALSSGEPFGEVAKRFTTFNTDNAGRHDIAQPDDGSPLEIFGPAELNAPALALVDGQTAGPIEFSDDLWWIHCHRIRPAAKLSLYDAQDSIQQHLRNERLRVEEAKFFTELLKRARISDFELMVQRIVEFAAVRYLTSPEE